MTMCLQDLFKENMKKIKLRILNWWNKNQLLDEKIKSIEEIHSILKTNRFDSVAKLLNYCESTGKKVLYSKELKKDFKIVGPDFIDVILLMEKRKREII